MMGVRIDNWHFYLMVMVVSHTYTSASFRLHVFIDLSTVVQYLNRSLNLK